jgi:hypothetical protein
MTREVVEQDGNGRPAIIIVRETAAERKARRAARAEQSERGQDVARSLQAATPKKSRRARIAT